MPLTTRGHQISIETPGVVSAGIVKQDPGQLPFTGC